MKRKSCAIKYDKLKNLLKGFKNIAIAFSGGVDSTFLLYAAAEVLGKNVIAVTAISDIRHNVEKLRAQKTAEKIGIRHILIQTEELSIPEIKNNSIDRCYFCKKNIFSKVIAMAKEEGISAIVEASTCDDLNVFRPGRRAVDELEIQSPLVKVGFSKNEIIEMLEKKDFDIFNTPSESCLLTRFPYNVLIDVESLAMVRLAEEFLKKEGFSQVRVRTYNDLARIEVPKTDIVRLVSADMKTVIVGKMKALGYKYITIDVEGFRSGSMDI